MLMQVDNPAAPCGILRRCIDANGVAKRMAVLPLLWLVISVTTVNVATATDLPDIPLGDIRIDLQPIAEYSEGGVPSFVSGSGDGSDRLFISTQQGRIRVVDDGILQPELFLDLSSEIRSEGEEGLLGFAFHPGFGDVASPGFGKLYTYATVDTGPAADFPLTGSVHHQNLIAEWQVDPENPNTVDVSSRRELVRFDHNINNHNGGMLAFGPDDYLYIAIGTSGGTPLDAQELDKVMGKILRVDPLDPALTSGSLDAVSASGNYRVPMSNPFVDTPDALDEIYAYGFRHPWRFSLDPQSDLLIVADVGQKKYEEISLVEAGGNYGWPYMEGGFDGIRDLPDPSPELINPIAQYDHEDGRSITGGYVYRGNDIADLDGVYVFGDLSTSTGFFLDEPGRLFYLEMFDAQGELLDATQTQIREFQIGADGQDPGIAIISFGQGDDGELYVIGVDGEGDHVALKLIASVLHGDMDGSGTVDAFDVSAFEMALADREAYQQAYPDIDPDIVGDIDASGSLDAFDVDDFEALLAGTGGLVPEPGVGVVLMLTSVVGMMRRP